VRSQQATSCSALEMPTSSDILQVILEYVYTDESPTIKGTQDTPDHAYTTCTHTHILSEKMLWEYGWKIALVNLGTYTLTLKYVCAVPVK
jgi:hypothetical protein